MPESEIAMLEQILQTDGRFEDMALKETTHNVHIKQQLDKLFRKDGSENAEDLIDEEYVTVNEDETTDTTTTDQESGEIHDSLE